jgi:hypothetical protein
VAAVALVLSVAAAACGSPGPSALSTAPPSRTPSPTAAPTAAPAVSSPAPATASASASGAGVPYDESLLALLPPTIADLEVVSTPEIAGDLGANAQLGMISDGFAAGVISDQASGELAVAMLIRLRRGFFGDAFFRAYRDSFDEAACAQAGGLVGHAEAEIGGHQTFIASCENGARTYHVHLVDPELLVSVTAVGETLRLGEAVVEALPG